MTRNNQHQQTKSQLGTRHQMLKIKSVRILEKESPLTTKQIQQRLYTEQNMKHNLPTTRKLSACLTRDDRFKKVGFVMVDTSPRILWGLN